jgi:hypothetical protein
MSARAEARRRRQYRQVIKTSERRRRQVSGPGSFGTTYKAAMLALYLYRAA